HNARKARSPVVSIVGEHATRHLKVDAPLTSDVAAFARTVSDSVRTARSADDVGPAAAETIAAAWGPPGAVAMLIVPADYSWSETEIVGPAIARPAPCTPSDHAIDRARRALSEPGTAILLGGMAVSAHALEAAGRTGARVMTARNVAKIAWGRGRFPAPQIPYFPEAALPFLADVKRLITVEADAPVSFFAYPDTPSYMAPGGCEIIELARRGEDGTAALLALGAKTAAAPHVPAANLPCSDSEDLTLDSLGHALAPLIPEDALIADEMVSSAGKILAWLATAAPHEFMPVTGGSIGQGLPVALGAAVACPSRKVIALEADGSGMYTLQALWTMARCHLDIAVVILANRRYRILDIEMKRTGANALGPLANEMIDIGNPRLDWVGLSEGCGVPATRARTAREFREQFKDAVQQKGPRLIEAVLT
ncbi:MAG TPA: acetolactate synthase large subunit, partial [Bryobacteraceae bacterium]|nr:acetolactate synthase large subunit [Bryobacteraceae bacterium]